MEAGRNNYRNELFKRHSRFYASVEEIPHALDRSALQRVIQLLKYHRNVYYDKLPGGDDIKPISAIINVLVTEISKAYNPECSVFELLEYVLKELEIYAQHLAKNQKEFVALYGARNVISHNNGVWYIANPANPEDNLANRWNENPRIPKTFFMWIKVVTSDLIDSLQQEAQFECQRMNAWWDSKLSQWRLGLAITSTVILMGAVFYLAPIKGIWTIIVCLVGIMLKLIERAREYILYYQLSYKISGVMEIIRLNQPPDEKALVVLQDLINQRRSTSVFGVNFVYEKLAKPLTDLYRRISEQA